MSWYIEDREFTSEDIGKHIGFIYLITEIETGKLYVGQKVFWNKVAKPPLKGKKNRRITKKESDWQDYFGSNEVLRESVTQNGTEKYRREIIRLCLSKSEMNYYETKEIYTRDALLDPNYFNSWVSCRVNRNQLKALQFDN